MRNPRWPSMKGGDKRSFWWLSGPLTGKRGRDSSDASLSVASNSLDGGSALSRLLDAGLRLRGRKPGIRFGGIAGGPLLGPALRVESHLHLGTDSRFEH